MKSKLKRLHSVYLDVLDAMAIGVVAVITLKTIYAFKQNEDNRVHPINVLIRTTDSGQKQVLVELSNGNASLWDVNEV